MIFGSPDTFAIEVGEVELLCDGRPYVPFQVIVDKQHLGDFQDRVLLFGVAVAMKSFIAMRDHRRNYEFNRCNAKKVFAKTFTAFYEGDYWSQPVTIPDLRQRYHFSEVGMDSMCDSFGIVVVEVEDNVSRIVAKDLRADRLIVDARIDTNEFYQAGYRFVDWAEEEVLRQVANGSAD